MNMKTYYKFKFYLNARHSVTFDNKTSKIHPHTWEVVISFRAGGANTMNFTVFENALERYFLYYEGKYLNEHESFKNINPTMENIGKVIYRDIEGLLRSNDLQFKSLEISENPTRTYIIETE